MLMNLIFVAGVSATLSTMVNAVMSCPYRYGMIIFILGLRKVFA